MRQQTRHTGRRLGSIVAAVVATMLAAPAAASGVTFCVADSSCSGTAVLDVQSALNLAGANPGLDRVQIGAGTFAAVGGFSYSPPAADLNPVEVLGSSRFLTFLTSSATPSTVLTVDGASSRVSNLTAQIPAGGNRGISVSGIASGVFVTQSVPPAAPNTSVGLVLRGSATGRDIGISMPLVATGEVLGVLDSSVGGAPTLVDAEVDAQVGVRTDPAATGSLVVRRTEMAAARGIDVSPGVNVSADNVQVRAGNASGLFVGVNAAGGAGGDATVDVNHLTILGNGDPSSFGLASTSVGGGNSTITVNAQNTILGGVAVSASRTAMGGMNVANLGISYSDFDPATAVGSPAQGPGKTNVRFTGRIGRRALRPGKHRVVALAVDAGSNRSESANARFRVVRTPHRR